MVFVTNVEMVNWSVDELSRFHLSHSCSHTRTSATCNDCLYCLCICTMQTCFFNPKYDQCYCQRCHRIRNDEPYCQRGKPPSTYAVPVGWCRFALQWVASQYFDYSLWKHSDKIMVWMKSVNQYGCHSHVLSMQNISCTCYLCTIRSWLGLIT